MTDLIPRPYFPEIDFIKTLEIGVKVNKDVFAGAFFTLLGAGGLWVGASYASGTAARMAAGYVPKLLCWALVATGALIITTGLIKGEDPMERWELRPLLLVLVSLLVFAGLIETAGLIAATVGLCLVAAAGSKETRWLETTAASLILAAASAVVFVKGLGLTLKIMPGL